MPNTLNQAGNLAEDPARAAALLHPLRLQILEKLHAPDSASGLARQMNIPRQKINYHLRELEKHGLIEPVEERKKGNCVERIVRATAHYYPLSPQAFGNLAANPTQIQDRFSSSYLVAVAARTIRDLAVLRSRADKAGKQLATFALETTVKLASAAELNVFAEELANAVGRLTAKYHHERAARGRWYKFMIGSYPAITKEQ